MAYWSFFDYLTSGGRNVMQEWLAKSVPNHARVAVRAAIAAGLDIAQTDERFQLPSFKPLSGQHSGLIEMIISEFGVQYRPLMCEGPSVRDATLLIGATKTGKNGGGKWTPHNARETALSRRADVLTGWSICPHE